MERFVCRNGVDTQQFPTGFSEEMAVASPDELHLRPDLIIEAARRTEKSGWVCLPFCNTLCSEALGAKPVLSASGARIKEPPYTRADELPGKLSLDLPRLAAMLHAVERLAADGKSVAYHIEGPFTLLCTLLPMNKVFSALRKPAGENMLQKAEEWVSAYAGLAVEKGARMLSFADPVATADILGERMFASIYVPCLKKTLARLRKEHPGIPVHLCGKLTQCLIDTQACYVKEWSAEQKQTYGEALAAFCENGREGVVGHFCLHFLDAKRPYLELIEFTEKGNSI